MPLQICIPSVLTSELGFILRAPPDPTTPSYAVKLHAITTIQAVTSKSARVTMTQLNFHYQIICLSWSTFHRQALRLKRKGLYISASTTSQEVLK